MTWSGQLMPAPLSKDSLSSPNGHPRTHRASTRGQACQSSSAPGRSIPPPTPYPPPGHSPGRLSALFLALWKGLFFFLFPWKGKHSPATLRLTPDPQPHRNRRRPSLQ